MTITIVITIAIVAGAAAAIAVPICAVQWARTRKAEADARLKQDMLARGLSVDEIERLTTSDRVREKQIAADLKRDMVARGLSVDDIERLSSSDSVDDHAVSQIQSLTSILATNGSSGETIEAVLAAHQAADPRGKRLLIEAIVGIHAVIPGIKVSEQQILGIVRGLGRRERRAAGDWQDAERTLPQPRVHVPEMDAKWGDPRIRAEPGAAPDRPRD